MAWMLGLGLANPGGAAAQMLSIAETEALVRVVHFEGMPEEESSRIGPDGCARLVEMLGDASEAAHHSQIMMAIGICGPVGGFEALQAWADAPRVGEIDRDTFRAWQALPFALGRLADHDRRALARLEQGLNSATAPNWTFRHHRGARLVGQARRSAATGLAYSGLPEAATVLDRAAQSSSDAVLREHVAGVREMHRARSAERRARRAGANAGGRR